MKLPSIAQIWTDYTGTYRRFPLVMIASVIGTVAAILLVEKEASPEASILYSILLSSVLAFPLLAALKLEAEKDGSGSGGGWTLRIIGVVLLIAYAFTVPSDLYSAPLYYLFRFFAFLIGCCFLFSFLPFRQKGQSNGFWQFNRIIVFRIILAGAFATVLFMGLGLALGALENLFGVDIPSRRYFQLWIMILGLFVVPFILSGIPENLRKLEEIADYPKSLKVLGQYVLPPLVLVYFVILYAYVAKIIFTWSWPQGWVGRLILGFSATGILALFVLDPLREKMETGWIKKVSRWYYLILLPLIVVLFLALWRRISEYAITEDRYLGLAIAVWLAFIAVYFLFSRAKSIKMIPASLCVSTFLISFGPWGMFSVSEQSQIGRLEKMLAADSILVNGMVQKAPSPISDEDDVEISSILSYLHQVHGFSDIQPWFAESLRLDSVENWTWFKNPDYVAKLMGIEYDPYGIRGGDEYFSVFIDLQAPISIAGYDDMVRAKYGGPVTKADTVERQITYEVETAPDSVVVKFMADRVAVDSVTIPLRPLIDRVISAHAQSDDPQMPGKQATYDYETADFKTRVVLLNAYFMRNDSVTMANSYDALIFYSRTNDH